LEVIELIEQRGEATPSHENGIAPSRPTGTFWEEAGPILAVKIVNSVIGDYWLVLSDDEPFDLGDGLPVYRPSEIRALKAKGYGSEALQSIHRVKVILDGKVE
jgi:hypothetical protein